jgi:hypothetical protein
MNELVQAVKATGSIGVVEFCSEDPKSRRRTAEKGHMDFDLVNSG